MSAGRSVDVQSFLNEHPFSPIPVGHLRPLFLHRPAGRIRYRRDRLHCSIVADRMGRSAAGSRARAQRGAVRSGGWGLVLRTAGRSAWPQSGTGRRRADLRRGLPRLRVLGHPEPPRDMAIHHRTGARRRHAERGDFDERVLPGRAARHAHQYDVLRLSARRGVRRLSGGLDDTALGLAQRAGARRHHASRAGLPDARVAARIGALHGGEEPAGRAHSRRAAPHLRNGVRSNCVRHDRKGARATAASGGMGVVLSQAYWSAR